LLQGPSKQEDVCTIFGSESAAATCLGQQDQEVCGIDGCIPFSYPSWSPVATIPFSVTTIIVNRITQLQTAVVNILEGTGEGTKTHSGVPEYHKVLSHQ
jgi:hypothetical protein